MGNREDKLRRMLKRGHLVKTPEDFTTGLMREIQAMAEEKAHANEKIKSVLQGSGFPAPSNAFTYKVLNAVREKIPTSREPVIGKGVWAGILLFIGCCVVITAVSGKGNSSSEHLYLISLGDYLSKLFGRYTEVFSYLAIALTSGSSLLLLDYYLNKPGRLANGR